MEDWDLCEHYNYMSIAEDPEYPYALHRLVLMHERVGNYQLALDSAYESQDNRIYPQDKEAEEVFNTTVKRLESKLKEFGARDESLQPKVEDETQNFFDDAFKRIGDIMRDFQSGP